VVPDGGRDGVVVHHAEPDSNAAATSPCELNPPCNASASRRNLRCLRVEIFEREADGAGDALDLAGPPDAMMSSPGTP
jgi:hypothetical protein